MSKVVTVATVIGSVLRTHGVRTVFGVVGSGNYLPTAALEAVGAHFVPARHESAAVSMADAFWRTTGEIAAASVHQGPGLSNAVTALGEAVKSRVPLVVISGATSASTRRSNFLIDQQALVESVGAGYETIRSPETAVDDVAAVMQRAHDERRPIVLAVPIDVQETLIEFDSSHIPALRERPRVVPSAAALASAAKLLAAAERPVILAGRGAMLSGAEDALVNLAEIINAKLCTSAMAHGLFTGNDRLLGICGGFSSDMTVETLHAADLVLVVGASLTTWTTRAGTLFDNNPTVIQIDSELPGLHVSAYAAVAMLGDARETAAALGTLLPAPQGEPHRDAHAGQRNLTNDVDVYTAEAGAPLHPGEVTARLETMLPHERTLVLDGGHFIGWPVRGLSVPDPAGFVFSSAGFQSIGLGMGSAVGAAIGRPYRTVVLACGDGGFLMGISELETMVRLNLPIVIVIYNDGAYGAEVHHFGADDPHVDLVRFADTDIGAFTSGSGAKTVTVRTLDDLDVVKDWDGHRDGPLLLDVVIDPTIMGEWAAQDFVGH
ncbi:thiamine pyrophosphate-dependent acetolactate synthase large subunit-like protein [Rhodoglobus vestalii]|uniref:Thiamine pyrophosphate-dependent acetolactate synthase large subunit-like protein n=1 Tax=Rhodoglobus vestalii TaxID=193384 RepID=A0A8H2PUS8_9MICO|nr:thiamine pyrophosphate-binding protein [Rhodoglobus vestalii]TQO20032.1 thiamine pyrophosphate-dependent acetolactate synthase large subunit-like protein [Rhodoglobus vestalii]